MTRAESKTEGFTINWGILAWLVGVHIVGMATLVAIVYDQFATSALVIGAIWWWLSNTAIGAGYHRCFAHPTHQARWPLKLFYLIFGAGSFQGPAMLWSERHRLHHADTDKHNDPYSVSRGFWWAHIGWVYHHSPYDTRRHRPADLMRSRLVVWQEKLHVPAAVFGGLVLPTLVGWYFGCPWQTLLLAGPARLVVQYHQTFAVNSVSHWFGQPSRTSAKDGGTLVALVTFGEGGKHGRHHNSPGSHMIDPRWYSFDPGKWFIEAASAAGLAYGLK